MGYQGRPGQKVDPEKIARIFVADDMEGVENFSSVLAGIAPELIQRVDQLCAPIWAELHISAPPATIVALADHISFALKRLEKGISLPFPLRTEVAHLYPRELFWAERLLTTFNADLPTPLPSEEAIPIALHLVNAAFNSENMNFTHRMTEILSQVLDMIDTAFEKQIDRESVAVARFITHLRYFFVRIHDDSQIEQDPNAALSLFEENYPDAHRAARHVAALLEMRLGKPVNSNEIAYLTLHIARLTQG
ncbi:MAG: PRD domain-containing protein [Actinomycetaceae bacterium]|nr:PRD domain-containing protein [Actinomycetaceae bacterium]